MILQALRATNFELPAYFETRIKFNNNLPIAYKLYTLLGVGALGGLKMITELNQISTETNEGKLLIAALAKITTESQTDKTPDEVIAQLNELADKMSF